MDSYMNEVIEMIDLTQNKPLNQIIYEGLRSAIISGIIPMGERINEKSYADALNVSRTPIREALHRIQDEDIVSYIPNYGIVTTKFTKKDVEEIYQIRYSLEVLATINAANRMTLDREMNLKNILTQSEEAFRENRNEDFIKLSKEFDDLIYEYAEMPRLRSMQEKLSEYLIRFRTISLAEEHNRKQSMEGHRKIFECMKANDIEAIDNIIKEHLDISQAIINKQFE